MKGLESQDQRPQRPRVAVSRCRPARTWRTRRWRPPDCRAFRHDGRQKVPTVPWAESSLPAARTVDHSMRPHLVSETWREKSYDICFPLIPSLPAGEGSERVPFGRGKIFPQVSHVAASFPAVYPYTFHSNERTRPVHPIVPHLMIGR